MLGKSSGVAGNGECGNSRARPGLHLLDAHWREDSHAGVLGCPGTQGAEIAGKEVWEQQSWGMRPWKAAGCGDSVICDPCE